MSAILACLLAVTCALPAPHKTHCARDKRPHVWHSHGHDRFDLDEKPMTCTPAARKGYLPSSRVAVS